MQTSPAPMPGYIVGFFILYGLVILLAFVSFVFWIIEVIDVAKRQFPDQNTKMLWLLVVVLGHGVGALVYYYAGKPLGWLPGETPRCPQYPPNYPPNYPPTQPPGQWPPPGPE